MARETAVTQATITAWLKDRPDIGQRHIHRAADGLDLRVYGEGPGGWFWRGRPRGVRQDGTRWPLQRVRVGTTAEMTLAGAIAAAAALKGEIARGGSPASERRQAVAARIAARAAEAARASNRELISLYAASMADRGATRDHTQREVGQVTRGLDTVGLLDMPPEMVTVEAVETMMARCPVKSRASRFASLNRFLIWALRRARSSAVPPTALFARHEKPKRSDPRQRVLTLDELKAVWVAAGELGGVEGDLVRFLTLVPCRRGEAALMKWGDIDLAGGAWTQPTSKSGHAHKFFLCGLALDILQARRHTAGLVPDDDAPVFTGVTKGGQFKTWSYLKRRLDARTGRMDSWTLHDLRRSFATLASRELKADDGLIDLTINHAASKTRNRVTATYNLNDKREERVRLMRSWDRLLVSVIEGRASDRAGTSEAEIVTLHAHTA